MKIDPDLVLPNKALSINQGGIKGSGWAMEGSTIATMYMHALQSTIIFPWIRRLRNFRQK